MKCLTSLKLGCVCWMGRRAASDIVTLHPSISSKHCSLSLEPTSAPPVAKDLADKDSKVKDGDSVAISSSRKLIGCTITDHSSNGTWVLKKKRRHLPQGALKLRRGRPTRINHGDIIYLLAPSHSDSSGYRYCLSNGPGKGEIVVCQLEKDVDERLGNDKTEIKNNTKDDVAVTNPNKRRLEFIDLTVETKSKMIRLEEEEKEDNEILLEDLEKCPLCLKDFPLSVLVEHVDNCTDNTSIEGGATHTTSEDNPDSEEIPIELSKCVYCADEYPLTELVLHVESCDKKKSTIDAYSHISPTSSQEPLERCMKCFQDFPLNKLIAHSSSCTGTILGTNDERFKDFVPSVYDVDALTLVVLTPIQQRAVNYVQEVSRKAAYEEYPSLCEKVIKLGYTPKDLQKVFHWVRSNAPIIIHINLDRVLSFLTKDTHYRNLFEIGTGGGSTDTTARRSWEVKSNTVHVLIFEVY
ncbi:PREDICTED: uncharacterized protein LOC109586023 [Amphimedon queenslandica]|uniref:FHA domain-containing protein n=1 Tax=Amphimedon queenslandica TaxID=400682 RepID=A0AAN0JLQ5_AMPQE|nr:PREDICTED: uncharacterized protein LOC109586023 [Amphimedon queenslandica]|eukprot:XP_019857750.1 PREDICTED: uncharacterized protein LOC109586023 [Amphimedon queenslandica]